LSSSPYTSSAGQVFILECGLSVKQKHGETEDREDIFTEEMDENRSILEPDEMRKR
jgi:hypothetical protein